MVQQFLPGALREFSDQLVLLVLSGTGGAYFRAILAPEQKWQRRVAQGVAGALSALFLGGFAAFLLNAVTDTGPFAWLACGFIFGSAGEAGVKWAQEKALGKQDD